MKTAFIGLGSNLQQPRQQVLDALDELDCIPESWLECHSSLYSSAPMGPQDQPDYINAVAALRTALPALELLDALQAIEQAHARVRYQRWGPRTLDLDLLLYGQDIMKTPRLTLPHPGIAERAFVLLPLVECRPEIRIPGLGSAAQLLQQCPKGPLIES